MHRMWTDCDVYDFKIIFFSWNKKIINPNLFEGHTNTHTDMKCHAYIYQLEYYLSLVDANCQPVFCL